MAGLTFKGKKCCVGKRGGVYIHKKKGKKRYLTKKEKSKLKKGGGNFGDKFYTKKGAKLGSIKAAKPEKKKDWRVEKKKYEAKQKLRPGTGVKTPEWMRLKWAARK